MNSTDGPLSSGMMSALFALAAIVLGVLSTMVFSNTIILGIASILMLIMMYFAQSQYKTESQKNLKAAKNIQTEPGLIDLVSGFFTFSLHGLLASSSFWLPFLASVRNDAGQIVISSGIMGFFVFVVIIAAYLAGELISKYTRHSTYSMKNYGYIIPFMIVCLIMLFAGVFTEFFLFKSLGFSMAILTFYLFGYIRGVSKGWIMTLVFLACVLAVGFVVLYSVRTGKYYDGLEAIA